MTGPLGESITGTMVVTNLVGETRLTVIDRILRRGIKQQRS